MFFSVSETHAMAEATVAKNEAFRSAMKLKDPDEDGEKDEQEHELRTVRPEDCSRLSAEEDTNERSPERNSSHK